MTSAKDKLLLDIKFETDALSELLLKRAKNPPELSKQFTEKIKAKQKRIISLGKKLKNV
jgi:hypothetical protein